MLNPDAPIEPGRGLGGIAIGIAVADILTTAEPLRVVELPGPDDGQGGVTIHSFGAIRTWSVDGRVEQVGAFEGYRGQLAAGFGVGSTVAEIRAACGAVVPTETEGVITLSEIPGIGIEIAGIDITDESGGDQPDPEALVVQIFVHAIDC